MSIEAAFMVPHPPMIIPEVGKESREQIKKTIEAYEKVADEIAAIMPETIIITSPHSVMYSDYFHISPGDYANGSFSDFGAGEVSFREEYDIGLRNTICNIAESSGFPAGIYGEKDKRLDHGTMVPLWFIRQKLDGFKIIRIGLSGLSLLDHYRLGMIIKEATDD
nr:AmmeMemoRadiSam system protein A [Lachnospiraceae bacterium]